MSPDTSESASSGLTSNLDAGASAGPRVGLFVTCLVNQFRPNIGWSALDLLEEAGCEVRVPMQQTCCGQPAFNSGDEAAALPVALGLLDAFDDVDYLVAPSGSCAGMIRCHLPQLIAKHRPERLAEAEALASRSYELMSFLSDILQWSQPSQTARDALAARKVAYHDSCSGLRELGVREQPRKLLAERAGLEVLELGDRDACCGFGGTFCIKQPEVSTAIADEKIRKVEASGADTLVAGDLGCLMHLAGRIKRQNKPLAVYHAAELLAGRLQDGSICDTGDDDAPVPSQGA